MDVLSTEIIKSAVAIGKGVIGKAIEDMLREKKAYLRDELTIDQKKEVISALTSSRVKAVVDVDEGQTILEIERHLNFLRAWSDEVKFKDMSRSKTLSDIFIQLDTFLVPRARHEDVGEQENRTPLEQEIIGSRRSLLIQGLPGSGKTTSMKRVVQLALNHNGTPLNQYFFPILVRLREIDMQEPVQHILLSKLSRIFHYNIHIQLPEVEKGMAPYRKMAEEAEAHAFIDYLSELAPLIILDGFDEIGLPKHREAVVEDVLLLNKRAPEVRIILTCRTGEFDASLPAFNEYEIAPLSWAQVESFSRKWIGEGSTSSEFVRLVKQSPFADTALKPLSLAHLCAIFERTGRIPEKPKAVYRRVVRLLLEDWDEQRRVRRISKYSNFDIDQKYEFLSNLAYYLSFELCKYVISHADLQRAYASLCFKFRLELDEQDRTVSEIESHTGLFVQSGFDKFEFSHKSLQEYLAAEHLVKMATPIRPIELKANTASEFAIATAISSEPSQYLGALVKLSFDDSGINPVFLFTFINRLLQEKPDLDIGEETFLVFVRIVSLWLCKGKIPKAHFYSEAADRFHGGFNGVEAAELPPIREFFTAANWDDHMKKFLSDFEAVPKASPSSHLVQLRRRGKKRVFRNYLDYFVLPSIFLDQHSP